MSDSADLSAIRARRANEMQQQQQPGGSGNIEQQRARQEAEENAKNSILSQVLDQNALARLSNIAAAKPEKARMLENTIIQMARRGQIASKMDDDQLKALLDRIAEHTQPKVTTVKFDRRRAGLDSDSD